MAHTPEQRDKNSLCGAMTKRGVPCRAFAGQGTSHPGVGRCRFHLGNTESHDKAAIRRNLTKRMVVMGQPEDEVTALGAMMAELHASSGHCAYLRGALAEMDEDELGTPYGVAVVNLYASERDRRVRIAKLCIEAGVDEAAIRVAEAQVQVLGAALARACDLAGLSESVKRKVGAFLRDELAAAQADPPPLRLAAG